MTNLLQKINKRKLAVVLVLLVVLALSMTVVQKALVIRKIIREPSKPWMRKRQTY